MPTQNVFSPIYLSKCKLDVVCGLSAGTTYKVEWRWLWASPLHQLLQPRMAGTGTAQMPFSYSACRQIPFLLQTSAPGHLPLCCGGFAVTLFIGYQLLAGQLLHLWALGAETVPVNL